ncbi:hypothetical protein [Micromonospora sp. NPDC005174]|uniref:hypothetical protein n=1 Tax=Micromonospora sp. NPDC005174 TaxID=3157018 RepID=UPI0033A4B923
MTDTPETPRDRLHQMIAAAAQREYDDSITNIGTVAHSEHLGSRIAAEVMNLFPEVELIQEGRYADGSWPQPAHEFPNFIEPTHARYELRTAPEPVSRSAEVTP